MHTIGTAAVIIHDQQVLLIRRNDLPVWAVPGGGLDPDETIDACCVREVKEETGLEAEIQRLVGLYARRRSLGRAMDIAFLFLCHTVGGALKISDETPDVRYWPLQKLPSNIPPWHRLYLADALSSRPSALWRTVSTPFWSYFAWPVIRLRRLINRLKGQTKFTATHWRLGAFVTVFDAEDQVLLVRRRDYPVWNLPGGKVEQDEAPWDAAVRETREETGLEINVTRLTGVYSKPSRGEIVLSFAGRIIDGQPVATEESAESRYFPVDALPDPTLPKHIDRIKDCAANHTDVVFRVQDTPSGLRLLGYK